MRINLIFGFLGSGKTTLVRRILETRPARGRLAVIVNEFGDVGIDGAILEGQDIDMVELTSGCLCCTLKGPLLNAVEELRATAGVEHIVIESTGIAQPEEMMETFADPSFRERFEFGPLVTVADAPKFSRLREMLGPFYTAQVENADIVILNKIDLASATELEEVRRDITALNPDATILFTEQCAMDTEPLLTGAPSRAMAAMAPGTDHAGDDHGHDHDDHRHAPAQSFVVEAGAGVARPALEEFFAGLPENVWRAKGFAVVDGAPALVQYTMGQLDLGPAEARASYRLVFIGPDMDMASIRAGFAAMSPAERMAGGPR